VTEEERQALTAVQFNWAVTPDDVWSPLAHHVSGLHTDVARAVLDRFGEAERGATPIGVVLEGDKGVGKTHMLRWVRQEVQSRDGYFFLVKFLEGREFWHSALHSVVSGFSAGQGDQLTPLLHRLCDLIGTDNLQRSRICGIIPVSRADLNTFADGLRDVDREVGLSCDDTARALVLYRARGSAGEAGRSYFDLDGDLTDEQRTAWGFRRRGARPPQEILSETSRLLALTGPAVIAVDQLDSLMAQSRPIEGGADAVSLGLVNQVADGLMELREQTRRTLTVVACIPDTWNLIRTRAVNTAADRFTVARMKGALPGVELASALVELHLAERYAEVCYTPRYSTWPILPVAFEGTALAQYTPRRLLQRVGSHIRDCLDTGVPVELKAFDEPPIVNPTPLPVDVAALAALDARFAQLKAAADVTGPVAPETEDVLMPQLLAAGLNAFVLELGEHGHALTLDPPPGAKPALHARLRCTLDERTEDEVHWGFRAIASTHHTAVLSRIRSARTEAGLRAGVDRRKLVLLRNTQVSGGPVTSRTIAEFEDDGGLSSAITDDDIRTFTALQAMLRRYDPAMLQWLAARTPAGTSELLRKVFPPDLVATFAPPPAPDSGPVDVVVPPRSASEEPTAPSGPVATPDTGAAGPLVPTGRAVGSGRQVSVPLQMLRKHAVIFAGSGSGKTVLLRRLIEECALHGVSSIVLDPNNDLARLGDPWPEPPDGWGPEDAAKAKDYLGNTDVVVWTPRKEQGRPLVLRPLPDFGDVLDDREEFELAVEAAVAGLVPRVKLTARKAAVGTAILQQALAHFARTGGTELAGFVELLSDLPDGVSELRSATKLAADMAEELRAAVIVDPLFGGAGTPLDPGVLLTPAAGSRARVSVISFIGLQSDVQRQTFVNQLQMALFSWIKQNPAGDRPLSGLLVMDEAQTFAPSGAATACTESTLMLSAQARKYGLGLMYATQAPKGLHNRISGNATTQFFGLLNSGVQINAATELARRKGGQVDDIARLSSGMFYAASEGLGFEKARMPMCLSHHPASALTAEEVIERARGGRG